jgi:hypothetical protein
MSILRTILPALRFFLRLPFVDGDCEGWWANGLRVDGLALLLAVAFLGEEEDAGCLLPSLAPRECALF